MAGAVWRPVEEEQSITEQSVRLREKKLYWHEETGAHTQLTNLVQFQSICVLFV